MRRTYGVSRARFFRIGDDSRITLRSNARSGEEVVGRFRSRDPDHPGLVSVSFGTVIWLQGEFVSTWSTRIKGLQWTKTKDHSEGVVAVAVDQLPLQSARDSSNICCLSWFNQWWRICLAKNDNADDYCCLYDSWPGNPRNVGFIVVNGDKRERKEK